MWMEHRIQLGQSFQVQNFFPHLSTFSEQKTTIFLSYWQAVSDLAAALAALPDDLPTFGSPITLDIVNKYQADWDIGVKVSADGTLLFDSIKARNKEDQQPQALQANVQTQAEVEAPPSDTQEDAPPADTNNDVSKSKKKRHLFF